MKTKLSRPIWPGRLGRLGVVTGVVALALFAAGAPGQAEPEPLLSVSGTAARPGQVTFFLSARDLPGGATLAHSSVSVRAGDHRLPSKTEAVTSDDLEKSDQGTQRGVVVVFDASGSMEGEPLEAARAAAAEYSRLLPADVALGLVVVSGKPLTLLELTPDRSEFTTALGKIKAGGKTALYDSVASAATMLREADLDPYAEQRILVLTDGEDSASTTSLDGLAEGLTQDGLTLDVVAFGADTSADKLKPLAEDSGGELLTASDDEALPKAFRTAASSFSDPVIVTAKVPADLSGRAAKLRVSVTADGQRVSTVVPLTFAVDPAAGVTLDRQRVAPVPSWLLPAALGVAFTGLLVVVLFAMWPVFADPTRRRRIAQLESYLPAGRGKAAPGSQRSDSPITRAALQWTQQAVRRRGLEEKLAFQLDQAGMSLRPHEWTLLRGCITLTAAAVLWLLLPWWLGAPLGLLAAWLLTGFYRAFRASRRCRAFSAQLPDSLQLLIGALRSGFSLAQAVNALVKESPDPVAHEFSRALSETRLGAELEDALERTSERTRSNDLSWIVMAIRIQREVGGNLAEVLGNAVETMRERERIRRHVRALSAEGRLSAWILILLPVGVAGWMFLTKADYLRPLWTEPMGIAMLAGGILSLTIGAFWVSRIVKLEV